MIDLRQERYESVPEFVRETQAASSKYSATSGLFASGRNGKSLKRRPSYSELEFEGVDSRFNTGAADSAPALEALWPGVEQDLFHAGQRGGSALYLMLGFISGVAACLCGVMIYAWLTHSSIAFAPSHESVKKSVVTLSSSSGTLKGNSRLRGGNAEVTTVLPQGSDVDLVVPAFSTYEVKAGDTLAVIAVKAYHRASPRLLDAICKANGMRSADVLSLGQKLTLPDYHPQINQPAL